MVENKQDMLWHDDIFFMELNTLFNLLYYRFCFVAIRRVESIVTTKRTAFCTYFTITVGAVKPGIYADFLCPSSKNILKIRVVTVISSSFAVHVIVICDAKI